MTEAKIYYYTCTFVHMHNNIYIYKHVHIQVDTQIDRFIGISYMFLLGLGHDNFSGALEIPCLVSQMDPPPKHS